MATGTDGDDLIEGTAGDDTISGGKGKDKIFGGDGNDTLNGGDGNDTVQGGNGDDRVRGGEGNDRVFGGDGEDYVNGDAGFDIVGGGRGKDIMIGGGDADQFYFDTSDVNGGDVDVVADFDRNDGDKIRFDITTLDNQDVLDALAAPGTVVQVADPGEEEFRLKGLSIEYVEGPATFTAAGRTVTNNPGQLDTKITFVLGDGSTQTIWVWNTQLQASDFLA